LKRWVRPGWRVLDIGAADGALALPLSQWGCRVTALEPAERLREGLAAEVRRLGIPGPAVLEKTWEEYSGRKSRPIGKPFSAAGPVRKNGEASSNGCDSKSNTGGSRNLWSSGCCAGIGRFRILIERR